MTTSVAILSVLLLAVAIVTATEAKSAGGCCVVYTKASKLQKLPLSVIKEYRVQEVTGSCHIPAVVFITQRNRKICANPKAKNVKQMLRQLRGRKNNGKDGRRRKAKQ